MTETKTDTYMLLFGLAILLGMGFLFWKMTKTTEIKTARAEASTTITTFTRDAEGKIIEILERTS